MARRGISRTGPEFRCRWVASSGCGLSPSGPSAIALTFPQPTCCKQNPHCRHLDPVAWFTFQPTVFRNPPSFHHNAPNVVQKRRKCELAEGKHVSHHCRGIATFLEDLLRCKVTSEGMKMHAMPPAGPFGPGQTTRNALVFVWGGADSSDNEGMSDA